MDALKEFGIQWPLLVASILNFFILLFLLKKFLYQPILKVLDERKETIEKSIKNAEFIEQEMIKTEERVRASLKLANEESLKIINRAHQSAEKTKTELTEEANRQATKIIERAKEEIGHEKDEATKAIKHESAALISSALRKIVKDSSRMIDEDKLMRETLEKING